jgi:nucleoside-diphosphate-sugar epimerase
MNRVLITGASGFLGRHCVPLFARQNCAVHAVVHQSQPVWQGPVSTHTVDLHDAAATARLIADVRPTHLLHLAWNATPGEFWTSPDNLDWVAASLRLVRSFAEHGGQRLVVAGTCAEYASSIEPLHEGRSPAGPTTLYGQCKGSLHQLLAAYARETGLSLAWARLFGLYGPHEHPRRIVAWTVRSLLAGQRVQCTSGQQERDFLHVRDAADALTKLLLSPVTGPINMASGRAVSIASLVQELARLIGGTTPIEFGAKPLPPHEAPRIVADISRLRSELGWQPSLTLSEGLAHAARWWKEERHDDVRAA